MEDDVSESSADPRMCGWIPDLELDSGAPTSAEWFQHHTIIKTFEETTCQIAVRVMNIVNKKVDYCVSPLNKRKKKLEYLIGNFSDNF